MKETGEKILEFRQGTWDKIIERKYMKEKTNSTRSEKVKDRYRKMNRETKRMTKKLQEGHDGLQRQPG